MLKLKPNEIKSVQEKEEEIKHAFNKFSTKEINYKPLIRPISSMDSINLHPYFTTTLLLPSGSVISHIDSSVAMSILKYENNAILLRPNANFSVANLTILYKLNEKNHILNVLASFYEKDEAQDKLNLIYSYSNLEKLDDLDVILAYVKTYNAYPKHKYSYIQIQDITYRIVEDYKNGNVFINNKKYRVDNKTIYK